MTKEMEKDLKRLQTITNDFQKLDQKAELIENGGYYLESISYMEKRFSKIPV